LNNLRLAGVAKDKIAPDEKGPVIVWMSYNVHGSEPASSEAAMKTIYAFADPENPKTKEWLKNTVLIIDPCINPDGRDRYVNWYNSYMLLLRIPSHKPESTRNPGPAEGPITTISISTAIGHGNLKLKPNNA
jgi:hypothetical protein